MISRKPKDTYVYIHYQGLTPIYVGMGSGNRVLQVGQRNHEWDGWRIVAEGLSRKEAQELEELIIETYGYENLANEPRFDFKSMVKERHANGEHDYNTMQGKKHSEETKKLMSEKMKEHWKNRKQ